MKLQSKQGADKVFVTAADSGSTLAVTGAITVNGQTISEIAQSMMMVGQGGMGPGRGF